MRRAICFAIITFGTIGAAPAVAEFVSGRLYASGGVGFCVKGERLQDDGIYEFDPLTGDWRIFATLPESLCGLLGGMWTRLGHLSDRIGADNGSYQPSLSDEF